MFYRFYCDYCLLSCNTEESLVKHVAICSGQEGQLVQYPSGGDALLKLKKTRIS